MARSCSSHGCTVGFPRCGGKRGAKLAATFFELIWERLHYNWSDPNHVVLTTTDSNIWGGASGHTYTFKRRPDGLTDIDLVVVRDGKNLKGRLLGFVLGTIGKCVLKKAFANSVKAIDARNGATRAARSSSAG